MNNFASRIQKLQKQLGQKGCLVEDPTTLFYLTGLKASCGKLLLSASHATLFVDGRYYEKAKSSLSLPVYLDSRKALLEACEHSHLKTLLFCPKTTSYERFLQLAEALPSIQLTPSSPLFETLRSIKEEQEVEKMQKSAQLLKKGFAYIATKLQEGVSEKDLAKEFEIFCLTQGAEGMAFEPIIAFGENSALPHHRSGERTLKQGDIVLLDMGVILDGYHSDSTRTLFFGEKNPKLYALFLLVQEAHALALLLCKPGTRVGEIDLCVRNFFKKSDVDSLFVHALGHGIGLQTHEFPRIKFDGKDKDVALEKGMVITIEPGLYQPTLGGIRHEDTLVITDKGYQNFYE